jgi:uncharacterized protein (DUF2141 family)
MNRAAVVMVVMVVVASTWPAEARQARDTPTAAPALTGTASIAGLVVAEDEARTPLRRATVTVTSEGAFSGRTAVTNDAGQFAVTGLPAGRYQVTASKGAYLSAPYGATRPLRPGVVRTGTPIAVGEGQQVAGLVVTMMRGGVITGVILDATGRPARAVDLTVSYFSRSPQNGERTLTRFAGLEASVRTDSRGIYRIYGLPPGEYVVSTAPVLQFAASDLMVTSETDVARASGTGRSDAQANTPVVRPRVGLATVYYPGTTTADHATPIRVGAGEEKTGIDFALQLVPNVRVEGRVLGVDGQPVPGATVAALSTVKPAGVDFGRFSARTDPRGEFSLRGVAPGAYMLAANAGTAWATIPASIQGDDVRTDIQLRPAISIGGTLAVDTGAAVTTPDWARVRVQFVVESSATPISSGVYTFPVTAEGRFTAAVMPGRYRVAVMMPAAAGASWIVKTAQVGGKDVADVPFDVDEGGSVADAVVTLTQQAAEVSGRMVDGRGQPMPDYFVILYPANPDWWGWRARRILQTRPGHDGTFRFGSLPPGDYLLAAVTDVDQNEWFDAEFLKSLIASSIRVSVAAGEKKAQAIQVR